MPRLAATDGRPFGGRHRHDLTHGTGDLIGDEGEDVRYGQLDHGDDLGEGDLLAGGAGHNA